MTVRTAMMNPSVRIYLGKNTQCQALRDSERPPRTGDIFLALVGDSGQGFKHAFVMGTTGWQPATLNI